MTIPNNPIQQAASFPSIGSDNARHVLKVLNLLDNVPEGQTSSRVTTLPPEDTGADVTLYAVSLNSSPDNPFVFSAEADLSTEQPEPGEPLFEHPINPEPPSTTVE